MAGSPKRFYSAGSMYVRMYVGMHACIGLLCVGSCATLLDLILFLHACMYGAEAKKKRSQIIVVQKPGSGGWGLLHGWGGAEKRFPSRLWCIWRKLTQVA